MSAGGSGDAGGSYKIYSSRSRRGALLSLGALLVLVLAFGDAFVKVLDHPHPVIVIAYALVTMIAIIGCAGYIIPTWPVLRRTPLLSLDDNGVRLHSWGLAIPWSNVSAVRISMVSLSDDRKSATSATLLFIAVSDERVLKEARGIARYFARTGIDRLGAPLWVSLSALAISVDDLCNAIERIGSTSVERP
jgi:hypothetical protein